MAEAINRALGRALEADPRVVLMGEDVGRTGGVFRVTDGLQTRFGPRRVVDTPLAESAIVGTAFGMALAGLRPVAEIQFMGFLYKAANQLIAQAAQIRGRTWGQTAAPLVVRTPYGGGVRTPEHHSDSLEALLLHRPGLKVVVPSTPGEAAGLLLAAIDDPDPVVFMEPIRLYRSFREEIPETLRPIPLGQARLRRSGRDVTLVAWGAMVPVALQAAEQIAREGIDAEVIDPRTLSPLDETTIAASLEKTGRLVVVHEAPRTGGAGAEIVAALTERCFYALRSPPRRVTGYDVVYPPQLLEDQYLPTADRVAAALRAVMED
ncbi:MAG TPA: alpha-ketoacid dehydrogenase subunit beta [Chloroflexota bacterium]|nr:alpha-ketoacid dehydrogenase subunit beta [Chloroflexota bacterium]